MPDIAEHIEAAMCEIDYSKDAENQGETEGKHAYCAPKLTR